MVFGKVQRHIMALYWGAFTLFGEKMHREYNIPHDFKEMNRILDSIHTSYLNAPVNEVRIEIAERLHELTGLIQRRELDGMGYAPDTISFIRMKRFYENEQHYFSTVTGPPEPVITGDETPDGMEYFQRLIDGIFNGEILQFETLGDALLHYSGEESKLPNITGVQNALESIEPISQKIAALLLLKRNARQTIPEPFSSLKVVRKFMQDLDTEIEYWRERQTYQSLEPKKQQPAGTDEFGYFMANGKHTGKFNWTAKQVQLAQTLYSIKNENGSPFASDSAGQIARRAAKMLLVMGQPVNIGSLESSLRRLRNEIHGPPEIPEGAIEFIRDRILLPTV